MSVKYRVIAVSFILIASLVLSAFRFNAASAFSGSGTGTEGDPYQIHNCEQLQEMRDELTAHYILMNDIDCSDTSNWNGNTGFEPVGSFTSYPNNAFSGSLDGQGFEITDLFIDRSTTDGVGMFGLVNNAAISNIALENVDVTGGDFTGALAGGHCGNGSDMTIDNVSVSGFVNGNFYVGGLLGTGGECIGADVSDSHSTANVGGLETVGGLVGSAIQSTIENSYATGNVSSEWQAGGLIGSTFSSTTILDSYATGNVEATDSYAGGLVGDANGGTVSNSHATGSVSGGSDIGGLLGNGSGTVSNSYATGTVSGNYEVGGLLGENEGTIENSYATGTISATDEAAGGLVGYNDEGSITKSYATGTVSSQYSAGGLVGDHDSGVVTDAYARGSVDGEEIIGGLIGRCVNSQVARSYSTGTVSGSFSVGGLMGEDDECTLLDAYWDTQTSDQDTSEGGEGKTTAQLKNIETYPSVTTKVTFDGYSWITANDEPTRDPISWTLSGSNNGSDWTVLDTRTDIAVTDNRFVEVGPYNLSDDVEYQYVKWEITKKKDTLDELVQAGELTLYHNGSPIAWPGTSVASSPDGDFCCGETPREAIDDDSDTKWLDYNFDNDGGDPQTGLSQLVINTSGATWDMETTTEHTLNDGYPFFGWQVGDDAPIWYLESTADADSDSDGISDEIEDAAPNDGDANNDGTDDSTQDNVSSFVNSITGQYVAIEVDDACTLTSAASEAESSHEVADSGFNYPAGLLNFVADCGIPGFTTDVSLYYFGVKNNDFVLRKYNSNHNAYFTVDGAVLVQLSIGGQEVTKAIYQVTDGESLDIDDLENGVIVDPVGLALGAVGVPNTGLGGRANN